MLEDGPLTPGEGLAMRVQRSGCRLHFGWPSSNPGDPAVGDMLSLAFGAALQQPWFPAAGDMGCRLHWEEQEQHEQ